MSIVLALDEGTTNAKAAAIDHHGQVLARATLGVSISHPGPGRVEQDPEEIWAACLHVLSSTLAQVDPRDVVGIAVTNQRESVVCWDPRTGAPAGPVLGWQDTRTAQQCAELAERHGDRVARLTGLPLDPMFSAPKLAWLLDRAAPGCVAGTIDSWLVDRLTGGRVHAIEVGNASRTLLLGLDSLDWEGELLDLFGIDRAALPQVRPSIGPFGVTACDGLPPGVPILAVMADSHAALRGHGAADPDVVKVTFGTGSSVMRSTGPSVVRRPGVASTVAWMDQAPVYAMEGNIRHSGSTLEWTARLLGLPGVHELGELASTVPDAHGAVLVPAFDGLGAPHWDPSAASAITGLGPGSESRAHLARAAFDAVAHQVADVVEAMGDEARVPPTVRADGGAASSPLLMQRQADLLARELVVVGDADLALHGVAAMAFAAVDVSVPAPPASRVHRPVLPASSRQDARNAWRRALHRTRTSVHQTSTDRR